MVLDKLLNLKKHPLPESNVVISKKPDKPAINQLDGTNSEETLKNDALSEIREKNPNRIIIFHLNINSMRKKFEKLKEVVGNKIDILLISETKLDDTFPLNQFI